MPTPTCDLIEEITLGSAQASITFSNIPSTYKHIAVDFIGTSTLDETLQLTFNNDSGTNYSRVYYVGSSSGVLGGGTTSTTYALLYITTAMTNINFTVHNYTDTNMWKPVLYRGNHSASALNYTVATWRSTAAITSMKLQIASGNISSGATARLWGIAG